MKVFYWNGRNELDERYVEEFFFGVILILVVQPSIHTPSTPPSYIPNGVTDGEARQQNGEDC